MSDGPIPDIYLRRPIGAPRSSINPFGVDPMKKYVDEVLAEGRTPLDAAAKYAKRNCNACRGNGYLAILQRAGATDKEPRTARICGCAKKGIRKEAQKRMQRALSAPVEAKVEESE